MLYCVKSSLPVTAELIKKNKAKKKQKMTHSNIKHLNIKNTSNIQNLTVLGKTAELN